MKYLYGHESPETAYVVDDYPYGFRLRCKIRYWVEHKPGKGFRMVSQTTNPKRGDVWNKPKASTYARFGLVMGINDEGHCVNAAALTEYAGLAESAAFMEAHGAHLPEKARATLADWVSRKTQYEQAKREGRVIATTTVTANGVTTTKVEKVAPEGTAAQ